MLTNCSPMSGILANGTQEILNASIIRVEDISSNLNPLRAEDTENGIIQSNCSNISEIEPTEGPVPEPPLYIMVCVSIVYIAIFIMGVVGNCLVVIVIWRNPDMRTTTNFFLVNLSVADLLVLLVCMPPSFVDLYTKEVWVFGAAMCK